MFAVTGVLPVLMAVKAEILPVPEAGRPMPGLSFVQEKEQDKVIGVVVAPFATVWLFCAVAGEVEASCSKRILAKSRYFFIFNPANIYKKREGVHPISMG